MKAALFLLTCLLLASFAFYCFAQEGISMNESKAAPQLKAVGPWSFWGHNTVIFTSDDQFRAVAADPSQPVKGFLLHDMEAAVSFEELVKGAADRHGREVTISYDFFFGGNKRELHLNAPELKEAVIKMNDVCKQYGLGFGASALNPLDLGWDFRDEFGVGGEQHVFQEGVLNPDGTFEVIAPLNKVWVNNKGPVELQLLGVKAFSFEESRLDGSSYYVVKPESIQAVESVSFEEAPGDFYGRKHPDPQQRPFPAQFVCGKLKVTGQAPAGSGNKVLVVLMMGTPEMDYFDRRAWDYTKGLLDWYNERGVQFINFYSDEMHIWFDWDLGTHFGPTELRTRYMSPALQGRLLDSTPGDWDDADKLLVYHAYGMHPDDPYAQHVLGPEPADVAATMVLRKNYFELLQNQVKGLCAKGREYAEELYGQPCTSRNHATWQESPTCDRMGPVKYDYTPAYKSSASIREAISGCYDYFSWGDYLTGGGNDFCEGGYLDRDYYGGAMTASQAAVNEYETSYWGAWGFPKAVGTRMNGVAAAYGFGYAPGNLVHDARPRTSDVLLVYPLDLLYSEERFGSWMVQYGYANYITDHKLLELGRIDKGRLKAGLGDYSTVVVLYSPFMRKATLALLRDFVMAGGTLIWQSAPAETDPDTGESLTSRFTQLFGVEPDSNLLKSFPTSEVRFEGPLAQVAPMPVLTDLRPDRTYPVQVAYDEVQIAARSADGRIIGSYRKLDKGLAVFLGCRLRDDQSASTGQDVRTLFEVLDTLGAYPKSAASPTEDNPEWLSRTRDDYFFASFGNGAVAVAPHFKGIVEQWPGGFFRDEEQDKPIVERLTLPPMQVRLEGQWVAGHQVSVNSTAPVFWRLDDQGELLAIACNRLNQFMADGEEKRVTSEPAQVAFALVPAERLPDGYTAGLAILCRAPELYLPAALGDWSTAEAYRDDYHTGLNLYAIELERSFNEAGTTVKLPEAHRGALHYLLKR